MTEKRDVYTLPGEKNGRDNKHKEDLVFAILNHQGLTFNWPSGTTWTSKSIYFHDNSKPNGVIRTPILETTVREALTLLQDVKRR